MFDTMKCESRKEPYLFVWDVSADSQRPHQCQHQNKTQRATDSLEENICFYSEP